MTQIFAGTIDSAKLLDAARIVKGRNKSIGDGQLFTRDCSGTVNAIFAEAGYPLASRLNKAYQTGMNGTAILHAIAESVEVSDIQPGDLVFFNDTYDRNGNGLSDDVLTHVGIVMQYDRSSGSIHFIHYNTWMDEIVEQQLNVIRPADKSENIILRWPSKNDPQQKRYAGELIHSFGRIHTY
nr:NlpC/P60 family protein [Entomospira entomophilus]